MKKLGTVIRYECMTSIRYIWIFYAIQYFVVALIHAIVFMSTGGKGNGVNALEFNTFVYVGIVGVLGFKEDFKMLLQSGFTRKYIFLAAAALFAFLSAVMALIDTAVSFLLRLLPNGYGSLFGSLYGYDHSVFLNWLWLFLVYFFICCLFYMIILVINKLGKKPAVYAAITLGLVIAVLLPALVKFVLPKEVTEKLLNALVKGFGFMADGTVNFVYPILLFAGIAGICSIISYLVLRRTELRA